MESLNLSSGTLPPPGSDASARNCRKCRAPLPGEAEFCGRCGTQNPKSGTVQCSKCGVDISVEQPFCTTCGTRNPLALDPPTVNSIAGATAGPATQSPELLQSFPFYYQEEFSKMQADPKYEGKWNWAAFFFGVLWAITKGLWGPVILTLGILFVSIPIGGLPGIVLWCYFGARGNSMYYKKAMLGQPWAFW